MRDYIRTFLYFLSLGSIIKYWDWYTNNYNNFTTEGAVGCSILGVILTILSVITVPYAIKDLIRDI